MLSQVVWLLDKNVVRRIIEGIGALLVAAPLTIEQSESLRLLWIGKRNHVPLTSLLSTTLRIT